MDTLSLKRYLIAQPSALGHANKNATKPQSSFTEFVINDKPLSTLLDEFYASNQSCILKNNIGVLGSFRNIPIEIIKVKQLTGKTIGEADYAELRNQLTRKLDENIVSDIVDRVKDELAEPGIMIYCCAQCGDYLCGGVMVDMAIGEHYIKWTFGAPENPLVFVFDKYEYLGTIIAYLNKIIISLPKP